MKVVELIQEVTQDLPGGLPRGFFNLVNRELERMLSRFEWTYYWARHEFTLPETFMGITVTNGSAVVTVPTAYFQEEILEGTAVTITVAGTDYDFTIESVDSATQITLTENWTESTSGAATLSFAYRSDWRLPADYRAMRRVRINDSTQYDPGHYSLDSRTSTGRELIKWSAVPTGTDPVVVEYVRTFTPVDSPNDTIDIDDIMERAFVLAVESRVVTPMMTGAVEDPMRVRRDELARLYQEAITDAINREQRRRRTDLVNKRTLFSRGPAIVENRYV